jgi:hypothetical protein
MFIMQSFYVSSTPEAMVQTAFVKCSKNTETRVAEEKFREQI